MRAVLIARTKNTGISRVMPMKSTPGWVFVVAVVVGVGVVGVAGFFGVQGVLLAHYTTPRPLYCRVD